MIEDKDREIKSKWPKRLAITFGVLLALLVVVYFVATSAFFLKSFILPKVSKSLNADVTVADASISPFSSVTLRDLQVKTTGAEPVARIGVVRARYGLREIIGGNIKVDEATLENPVIHIVKNPDGTSNLDPILNRPASAASEPSTEAMNLNIRNIALKNGAVRISEKTAAGAQSQTGLSNLNVTIDQIANNQNSTLKIASDLLVDQRAPAPGTNQLLAAKIDGTYTFTLNPTNFVPTTLAGQTGIQISRAEGGFADAAGVVVGLVADVTPTQVKELALRLEKGGRTLGQIRASGPLDTAKLEGTLTVEVSSLDRNALNLSGMDFAESTINSTNTVDLRRQATLIAITGRLVGQKLGVVREGKGTPPVDLDFDYRVSANLENKSATLEKILLSARHKNAEFLNASVDRPLNLSWGSETYGLKDSNFRLALTNFNLADWQTIIGTNAPEGILNANVRVRAQNDAKLLGLETDVAGSSLAFWVSTNLVRDVRLGVAAKGTIENVTHVTLSDYRVNLEGGGKRLADVTGAVRYNLDSGDFNFQALLDAMLPALVAHFKLPGVETTSGVVKYNGTVEKAGIETKANGTLQLDEFTGTAGGLAFDRHQILSAYNVEMRESALTIHRATLALNQGFQKGGTVEVTGRADLAKNSGEVAFKLVELNQHALGPVLASSLGDKKLVSASLNSSGTASFSTNAGNAVKAEVKMANLVVRDPAGSLPATPLELGLQLDVGQNADVIDVRNVALELTPTERASNRLQIQGKVDMRKTNAAPGSLTVSSDALDLTRYYDIFAGGTNQTAAAEQPGAAPAGDPNKEPEPVELPMKQFTADLKIGALYLRELAISNWVTTAKINSNTLTMRPLSMAVNGAPVNADVALDLGVAGYKYDVAFKADRVPVEPLANTFAETNKYKGFLVSDVKIKGAGTTGANLRKYLQGQVSLSVTNFDFQVVGPKMRRIVNPIALILRVPELTQTPVNWVDARADIGDGKVAVQKAALESEAFFADVKGDIMLNDVLTNSTLSLPVALSLRRSLAEKAGLLPDNTPTNAKYAPLPQFVTVKGTLGEPDPDINKLAIAGLLARAGIGLTGTGVSENAKAALDLLTGSGSKTNAPGTNSSPANLIQGLGGLLNRNRGANAPSTNAPAGGTNAPATNAPVQNLLNIFKK